MSLVTISRDHRAGFEAGLRDRCDRKPLGLFADQEATPFGQGYVAGYRAAKIGRQETWGDVVGDLLLEFDVSEGW